MDERSDMNIIGGDKMDEVMLPGFRFHPTDEELVGFYLKRKIQQRPLSIELIKQLDIYKFDPWDLPKLAASGEKEWYFYCPRDRKYRNSTRPNRVTGAGFWKATGTDRPIYSSEGACSSKCIGLKKSLVFYKGRAAKGVKTDWMMHEFRLPSLTDSLPPKRSSSFMDKTIPANDSWAICRIFKKTNSSHAHQRALSHHSWVSVLPETNTYDDHMLGSKAAHSATHHHHQHEFSSERMPLTSKTNSSTNFCGNNNNDIQISSTTSSMSPLDIYTNSSYKPVNPLMMGCNIKLPYQYFPISNSNGDYFSSTPSFTFSSSPLETPSGPVAKCTVDVSSLLLNMSSSMLGDYNGSNSINKASAESTNFVFSTTTGSQDQCNGGFSSMTLPHHHEVMQGNNNMGNGHDTVVGLIKNNISNVNSNVTEDADDQRWETSVRSNIGVPLMMSNSFPLPLNIGGGGGDAWKSSLTWESSPCPSEMSTTRCYT
ncbi:unnamed protein product [Prunus armeniaca]|uniref:NAC domain-containing protein n=1 Tax=Prunus armeniaca TaxID=36596 RepID=A0A6J5W0Z1_PRUAR|nr:hypothetical protein GBA52_002917 [Prunus armeniaca]CAB4295240.1 unnamed protein product [Prunus armeniaca]